MTILVASPASQRWGALDLGRGADGLANDGGLDRLGRVHT